jgi:cellobiose-specific phosphotransferase system component IIA
MKKCITTLTGLLFLLCFSVTTSLAQNRSLEGAKIAEASRILISDGQILEKFTCQDKAKMIEQAQKMLKKGHEIQASGEMMFSGRAKANMQDVGQMMVHGGDLLLKKGKQKGEITAEDKAKINKLGKDMIRQGNLLLKKGETM